MFRAYGQRVSGGQLGFLIRLFMKRICGQGLGLPMLPNLWDWLLAGSEGKFADIAANSGAISRAGPSASRH